MTTTATTTDDDRRRPEPADIRVWLNGADTPQEARDWLKTTFEDQNPGSTLTIEEQEWDGLVERLTTALSSESETPDVVEIGNTQAPTFTSAGAFSDLTDQLDDLGGDDLLQGFVDGATVDGKTYAVPYYAGSKYVFYRKDLFEKAGIEVPTTMDEFVDAAIALKEANPKPANFSGFWFPGQDWRNGAAFIWDAGGDLAVEDGGEWTGALSSAESVAGLETRAEALHRGVGRGQGRQRGRPVDPVLRRRDRHDVGPRLDQGPDRGPGGRLPRHLAKNIGVFALPGSDGEPAPVLLGGSDIAIAAKSPNQELAQEAVALMLSDDYQTILAENGLTPAPELAGAAAR